MSKMVPPFDPSRYDIAPPAWMTAPIPHRWHRCTAATSGFAMNTYVERCACGAINVEKTGWSRKNSRRKSEKQK